MKKNTLLLCLFCALFFACSEDDQPQLREKEKVQFSLDVLSPGSSGGRVASEIPPGSTASVEILGPHGTITENIEILTFGDRYITAPIELSTGSHKLISFMIVGEDSQVLFAAPKDGSPLAGAVDSALPNTFVVQKGKIRNFPVQVIDVSGKLPEHFGYASFGIEIVTPLAVTVFVEEGGELVMTEASASLQRADVSDTSQHFALAAKVNYISFDGDESALYAIRVEKPGYESAYREFVYDELGENHSLTFVLTEEQPETLRLDAQAYESGAPFVLVMRARLNGEGTITVNWGDGTVETKVFTAGALEQELYHAYDEEIRNSSLTLTGDLDKVTKFFGTNVRYHNLDVLPNLEDFRDFRSDLDPIAVDSVDLSQNYQLTYIELSEPGYKLVIGDNKINLNRFYIRGQYRLDLLVPELQKHITSTGIRDGMIEFFHGPSPTEEQIAILRELRTEYGWYIAFDYEAI